MTTIEWFQLISAVLSTVLSYFIGHRNGGKVGPAGPTGAAGATGPQGPDGV